MLTTKRDADWLEWIVPDKFNDKDLFRIVIFFVFHSPCPKLSAMGKSLSEYGWKTPWSQPYSLKKQLCQAASNNELIFSAQRYDDMETTLEKADLKDGFPYDFETERVCIYNNQKNQFLSVFYHLRNAFAHCRLNMFEVNGECVFAFEDVQAIKNSDTLKVSARMILKKSTLLHWIDIIEGGEKEYHDKNI